ncbi:16 kD immunogenic protein [Legionella wadsworthii]|uniref:16 kD immunogenic protein n=1 Tax=Legionella wadsworthii TaxID=28088 RepID=A0A378LQT6_9GAMM|nr:Spy/CpxP family protein refolding chaperone [Legionella wadsworthii]STY29325.1 16 kD immunogenic protein [Legionella wadsworthii]
MYKKIMQIAAFAATLVLSPVVLAHSGECGGGLKSMVESLKLDQNQKSKIEPILNQLKTTIKNDAAQMRDLSQQIHQQVQSTNMDQSVVDNLIDKKTKLIGDMMKAKITAKNQIYAILNQQQKTELQNRMKKMEEKMAEKFKKCHEE